MKKNIFIIAILALSLSGCFNAKEKKEIAELKNQVEALQEENGRLSENVNKLQAENNDLQGNLDAVRRESQKLRQINEAINQVLGTK